MGLDVSFIGGEMLPYLRSGGHQLRDGKTAPRSSSGRGSRGGGLYGGVCGLLVGLGPGGRLGLPAARHVRCGAELPGPCRGWGELPQVRYRRSASVPTARSPRERRGMERC